MNNVNNTSTSINQLSLHNDKGLLFQMFNPSKHRSIRKQIELNNCNHHQEQMYQMKVIKHSNNNLGQMNGFNDYDNLNKHNTNNYKIYKINSNHESLNSIAAKFRTTPTMLKSMNRMYSNHVFVGQHLMVPN